MSIPSYVSLFDNNELQKRTEKAIAALESCRFCPRQCKANRSSNNQGFCRTGRKARVASFHAHFGEEAPLVGRSGSGTIFFSSCNLLCSFCQNYEISHHNEGTEVSAKELATMMIDLARRGCHNINLVTPSHVVPQILEALVHAVEQGLNVPLVYNSGGYDAVETLKLLDGVVDIYMPDFKFADSKWSELYCRAPDYAEVAKAAVREMHRQVGDLQIDDSGVATRGLLVRHLVMPNGIANSKEILAFIANELSTNTYVNVMAQYRPCGTAFRDEYINRGITMKEFSEAVAWAKQSGIVRLD